MSGNLNRAGFDSYRNKAKPWRPQRIDKKTGKIHPMDRMKLGSKGQEVNSTGCFGIKSSGLQIHSSHIVKKGAPGRNRSGRKQKNVSRLYVGNVVRDFNSMSKAELLQLRANILTYKHMLEFSNGISRFPKDLNSTLERITKFLVEQLMNRDEIEEMFKRDVKRYQSTRGMMKTGGFAVKGIKSLDQRIQKAVTKMNIPNKI